MAEALFVAAFDSQLKWCSAIRDELARRGFDIGVVVPDARSALSRQQVIDAGFTLDDIVRLSWSELVETCLSRAVVVSALAGPSTKALSLELSSRIASGRPGPMLVSGWVGVIIEKPVAGYLDRCGTDVVAVNSADDLRQFVDVADRLALPAGNLLLSGLPFLSGRADKPTAGRIRRVLYADQPTVPARAAERAYIYHRLVEYALAHPEREVLLKPRHRLEEDTFHRMRHHPATVLSGVDLPANFRIDYASIQEQLSVADLLITMSSTAALEALDRGCRVALVLDLGIHERHGNQVFLNSGLLRSFSQIQHDDIGTAESRWLGSHFPGLGRSSSEIIVDRIDQLLLTGERPAASVWETDYFRSAARFHRETSGTHAGRFRAGSWERRMAAHGPLLGSALHLAHSVSPPVITAAARRAKQRVAPRG